MKHIDPLWADGIVITKQSKTIMWLCCWISWFIPHEQSESFCGWKTLSDPFAVEINVSRVARLRRIHECKVICPCDAAKTDQSYGPSPCINNVYRWSYGQDILRMGIDFQPFSDWGFVKYMCVNYIYLILWSWCFSKPGSKTIKMLEKSPLSTIFFIINF